MGNSVIYLITNLKNNKKYVGITKDFHNRKWTHLNSLRKNKHRNNKLQNSFNKHKENSFKFTILGIYDSKYIEEIEKQYIGFFDSVQNGYNIEYGGNYNKIIGKETKKKLSALTRGELNFNAIIKDEIALSILKDLSNIETTTEEIVKKYNISSNVVYNLILNKSYKHLLVKDRENIKNRAKLLQTKKLKEAEELRKKGYSENQISKFLKISRNTLRKNKA